MKKFNIKKLIKNIKKNLEKYRGSNKKTYYDNLKELTAKDVFNGLLGYGMFSDKIPPFLSSTSFLEFCENPPSSFNFETKPKTYITYESMRNINIPRVLSIPHPIAYRNQCKVIMDNWKMILKYFKEKTKNSTFKISRIHIRKIDNCSSILQSCYDDLDDIDLNDFSELIVNHIFEMNHKNFCTDDYPEPELLIGSRYMVKADISNCFPSIYSHSISWALVGKELSKQNAQDYTKWYNQIDESTRNLKEAETHGVLIGPHSSNLISEIILVAIDNALQDTYKYIRNVDDYVCYVETKEKAEKFLIDLSYELKKFNLMLNHKKTEIIELPLASADTWIRKINSFPFSSDDKIGLNEVRTFLDISLDLMKKNHENAAILNYAIKVLSKREFTKYAKQYFLNTIHHLVLIYPYLVSLLDKKFFCQFKISNSEIERISKNIYEMAYKDNLNEALSYSIYFAIKYDFKLSEDLDKVSIEKNDPIIMLLSYLHDKKYVKHSSRNKEYRRLANSLLNEIDEYWIFVYEVLKGNLRDEWKVMKKENVTFIDEDFKEKYLKEFL